MRFKFLKFTYLLPLIITAAVILTSCTKEQRQDIKEKIDTASQKLGHDADTLINNKMKNDSIFTSAPADSVGAGGLPSDDFRSRLNDIFDDYEDIKDQLSKDDSTKVNEYAEDMNQALLNVDVNAAAEKLGSKWKLWVSQLEINIKKILAAKTLKDQRREFAFLTGSVENMVINFGLHNKTIYKISCAYKNQSLTWLTESKNFDNPYYGTDNSNERSVPCKDVKRKWEFK